jgi:hypothetical protein
MDSANQNDWDSISFLIEYILFESLNSLPQREMVSENLAEMPQAQRERLSHLELRVFFTGECRRSDIETRFGVKPAAATRDIGAYRELAPGNLEYDPVSRCYRPSQSFKPLFGFSTERVLSWLLQGFGDGLDLRLKKAAPCEGPGNLVRPNLEILATITRALYAKKPLKITYVSLSSGPSTRVIVPVALADNGMRWHVRAFDRSKSRFSDFVLTRITKARELQEQAEEHELLAADEQWARIVELAIVPHPGLKWPAAIESDYSMEDGGLKIRSRAALAGYVLRRWSIDSSEDHHLDANSHHLWLSNSLALYGVESAVMAPGYFVPPKK